MSESWDVSFGPVDNLNPDCGYAIRIKHNGQTILVTATHPVTGADLDFTSCLEVAGNYGPGK